MATKPLIVRGRPHQHSGKSNRSAARRAWRTVAVAPSGPMRTSPTGSWPAARQAAGAVGRWPGRAGRGGARRRGRGGGLARGDGARGGGAGRRRLPGPLREDLAPPVAGLLLVSAPDDAGELREQLPPLLPPPPPVG